MLHDIFLQLYKIEDEATQLSQTLNGISMYRNLEYLNIIKDLL